MSAWRDATACYLGFVRLFMTEDRAGYDGPRHPRDDDDCTEADRQDQCADCQIGKGDDGPAADEDTREDHKEPTDEDHPRSG